MPNDLTILHFNAIRLKLNGSGNLKLQFQSSDDVVTQDLVPLIMQVSTNIHPTRLANFKQQHAKLRIYTTEINETFRINTIIIFVRPLFTSFPG